MQNINIKGRGGGGIGRRFVNPFNAEATYIQSRRMQVFLKII